MGDPCGRHAEWESGAPQAAMAMIAKQVPPLQQEAVAAAASTWLASVASILQVSAPYFGKSKVAYMTNLDRQ